MIAIVAVVIGLTAVAWLEAPPELTAHEAVDAAVGALAAAGHAGATVDPEPARGDYVRNAVEVPVWKTTAELDDGRIALWIARDTGDAVYLDDLDEERDRRLLTNREVADIAGYDGASGLRRQLERNLVATLAAALIVAVTIRLLAVGARPLRADRIEA